MTRKSIVLAHGFLGFGGLAGVPTFVNYFNGVAAHFLAQGHSVIAPQVDPAGSVAKRGGQLAAAILGLRAAGEKLHVVSHSMGGLDARHALANVPGVKERVATLVTIGCPHRGSPVADAVVNNSGPVFRHVPPSVVAQLKHSAVALHDLTTPVAVRFDELTPDVDGVRYIEVAGDASKGGPKLFLFELAAAIGELEGCINDGFVTRGSSLSGRPGHVQLEDWPVDHGGEIGWSYESPLPIELGIKLPGAARHLARYDAIVAML